MKTPESQWPTELYIPTAKDFVHDRWAAYAEGFGRCGGWSLGSMPADELGEECGTVGCLVGNVRYAFGLPCRPSEGGTSPAGEEFMAKICELAGKPDTNKYNSIWYHASDLFEGTLDADEALTKAKAAALYRKAAAHFGYTVPVKPVKG